MKIISGSRGSGRTTKLRDWAMEDPANRGVVLPHLDIYGWDGFRRAGGVMVSQSRANSLMLGHSRLWGVDDAESLLCASLGASIDQIAVITLPGEMVDLDVRRIYRELQEIRSSCQ